MSEENVAVVVVETGRVVVVDVRVDVALDEAVVLDDVAVLDEGELEVRGRDVGRLKS